MMMQPIIWTRRNGWRTAVYDAAGPVQGACCIKLSNGWSASGTVRTPDGRHGRIAQVNGHKSAVAAMRAFDAEAARLYALGNAA